MLNLYLHTLTNTFSPNTPAPKKEWFNFIAINLVLTVLIAYIGFNPDAYLNTSTTPINPADRINYPQLILMFALLPTTISIIYRRLVDSGSSKFFLILFAMPLVGQIAALIFLSIKTSK